jgi:pyruvate dehydrogenase E1 component alpha subunit
MIDKEAKLEVDEAVEEAKKSPEPAVKDLWTDIYYKGTEPPFMRGREREEVRLLSHLFLFLTSNYC